MIYTCIFVYTICRCSTQLCINPFNNGDYRDNSNYYTLTCKLWFVRFTTYCVVYVFYIFSDHGHSSAHWGRFKSLFILLIATILTSLAAEIIVNNIESLVEGTSVTLVSTSINNSILINKLLKKFSHGIS